MDLIYLPAARRPRRSSTAQKYAIRDLGEACAYLRDPLLGARYEEITAAVSDQLARGMPLEEVMGSRIDALKLVSSLTLFRAAARALADEEPSVTSLALLCDSVLEQAAAQGYSSCTHTGAHIERSR